MEKGTLSYDFIIATVMFLTVYVIFIQTTVYPITGIQRRGDILKREGSVLTQLSSRYTGYPSNWSSLEEVEAFGLTLQERGNNPNILDEIKLQELNRSDCGKLREKHRFDTNLQIEVKTEEALYKCNNEEDDFKRHLESPVYIKTDSGYKEGQLIVRIG